QESSRPGSSIRLFDEFKPGFISGSPAQITPPKAQEWTFTGSTAPDFWQKGPGIDALKVVENRLSGKTTTDFPIIAIDRSLNPDDKDPFYALEIRMKASSGKNISFSFTQHD